MSNIEDRRKTSILLAVLCLGLTFVSANRTALYPLLPIIGDKYRLTNTQLGTITSSYFLVYAAMQIPSGFLGDKVGKKRLLTAMYLLSGLALLSFALLAKSYVSLVFFVALHGLGAGSYYPSAFSMLLSTVDSSRRATAAAVVGLGFSLGLILGLAASGPIYLYTGSFSGIFLILSILTLFMVPVFQKYLPDVKSSKAKSGKFDVGAILKNKNVLFINIAQFCALFGHWVAITWGPTFFVTERGISLKLAGMFVAITGISAVIPSLVVSRISDKIGRKRLAVILFPLGALSIFLMAYANSNLAIIASLVAYGIVGKSSWDPIAVAWMGEHALSVSEDALGTATGIFNFFGMMSAVLAPTVSGYILDITNSLVSAFYFAAIVSLVGGFLIFFVQEKPQSIEEAAKGIPR